MRPRSTHQPLQKRASILATMALLIGLLGGCRQTLPPGEPFVADPAPTDAPYVLVLGTAQDGGCPQIGAHHHLAERAWVDPRERRLVASILIADPRSGGRWLIDATPDIKLQTRAARRHPSTRPPDGPGRPPLYDGVFLTHAHVGHYAGLLQFGREAHGSEGQPTWASPRMGAFLRENAPWNLLVEAGHIRLQDLAAGRAVRLAEDLSITPIEVPHRAEFSDTFAFRIDGPSRSLLYLPDIDKWHLLDPPIEGEIARVDFALLDGTFFADGEIPGRSMADIPHPFIEESLARFGSLPATERDKIRFTHLNHGNPAIDSRGEAAQTVRAAGMHVAREGQVFAL